MDIFELDSASVTAWATVVLVGVTTVYALLVWLTLKEMQKSRKAEFIGRRLEKFYYPFLNFLESNISVLDDGRELRIRGEVYYIANRKSDSDYKDFSTHQYLTSKKIKENLDKFFRIISQNQSTKEKENIDLYEKIKNDVEMDIEILNKNLNDLI